MKASDLTLGQSFAIGVNIYRVVKLPWYGRGRFHAMQAKPISGPVFDSLKFKRDLGLSDIVSIEKSRNVTSLP